MEIDPVASFRCWEIEVSIGEQSYTIPALSAADWLPALVSANPLEVVPGMIADSAELDEAIIDGVVSLDHMIEAGYDTIEQAAGMPYWPALLITRVLTDSWEDLGSRMVRDGFRFDVQSLGAALSAAHGLILSRLKDKAKRDNYLATLNGSGPAKSSKRSRSRAVSDFAAEAGPLPANASRSGDEPPKTRKRPAARPPRVRSSLPSSPPEQPVRSGLRTRSNRSGGAAASDKTSR